VASNDKLETARGPDDVSARRAACRRISGLPDVHHPRLTPPPPLPLLLVKRHLASRCATLGQNPACGHTALHTATAATLPPAKTPFPVPYPLTTYNSRAAWHGRRTAIAVRLSIFLVCGLFFCGEGIHHNRALPCAGGRRT